MAEETGWCAPLSGRFGVEDDPPGTGRGVGLVRAEGGDLRHEGTRFGATTGGAMDPKNAMNIEQTQAQTVDMDATATAEGAMQLGSVEGALALDVSSELSADGEPVTREQRRSRRKREVRARTISVKRMTKRELELGRLLYPEVEVERPKTRADCANGARPCPFVSCKHHLFLDVSARTGAIKLNFPDLEVWDMNETCALDVADRGGTTLEEVGAIMNLTRERIRQVEVKGLAKLQALSDMDALRDYVDEGPVGRRRLPVLAKSDDEEETAEAEVEAEDFDVEGFVAAEFDAE